MSVKPDTNAARRTSRRRFLADAAIASTAAALTGPAAAWARRPPLGRYPICVFTKPFQSLGYAELAERIAELEVEGIEAPIREGGHIEPQQVPDELPKMVAALAERGLEITIMASSINEPTPAAEAQLRTAASLGVRRYRLQYFHYDRDRPIPAQLDELRPRLRELAELNRELGVQGLYQNHAGARYVGSAVWDLHDLLRGIDPAHLGVAYDIRHATAEGGQSWPIGFRLIRPHIGIIYVKDFAWRDGEPAPANVPLGDGRIDPAFFGMLADSGYSGAISLHEEYLDHRDPTLVPEHLAALRRDLAVLRGWLRG